VCVCVCVCVCFMSSGWVMTQTPTLTTSNELVSVKVCWWGLSPFYLAVSVCPVSELGRACFMWSAVSCWLADAKDLLLLVDSLSPKYSSALCLPNHLHTWQKKEKEGNYFGLFFC